MSNNMLEPLRGDGEIGGPGDSAPPAAQKPVIFSWTAPDNHGYRAGSFERLCPWPEWSDVVVNNERWGLSSSKSRDKRQPAAPVVQAGEMYEDPAGKKLLLHGVEVGTWTRLSEYIPTLGETVTPIMWDEQEYAFDLLSANSHLVHLKVFRQMVAVLHALWELGNSLILLNHNHVPGQSAGVGRPWRPWSLVYSMCRAGASIPHQPLFNPNGKYIVKLFVLGMWRRVTVDDFCPLDKKGRPLLLRSQKLTELWPFILSKAMMQVLCAGRVLEDADVEGHQMVTMLTGCIESSIQMRYFKTEEIWGLLSGGVLTRYQWPQKAPEPAPAAATRPPSPPGFAPATPSTIHEKKRPGKKGDKHAPTASAAASSTNPTTAAGKNTHNEKSVGGAPPKKGAKPDKGKSKKSQPKEPEVEEVVADPDWLVRQRTQPFVLAMMEDDQDLVNEEHQTRLSGELPHLVLLSRYRDVPLLKPAERPPTPPWKNIRRYLWDPDLTNPPRPIQMLEAHSPLLDVLEPLGAPISETSVSIEGMGMEDGSEFSGEMDFRNQPSVGGTNESLDKTVETGMPRVVPQSTTMPTKTMSLLEANSAAPVLGRFGRSSAPSIIISSLRETKTWIHMDEFCKSFRRLHLFYTKSALKYRCMLSDVVGPAPVPGVPAGAPPKEKEKSGKSRLSAGSRNSDNEHDIKRLDSSDPIFLFMDNIEPSEIHMNLEVAPREPPLEPPAPELEPEPGDTDRTNSATRARTTSQGQVAGKGSAHRKSVTAPVPASTATVLPSSGSRVAMTSHRASMASEEHQTAREVDTGGDSPGGRPESAEEPAEPPEPPEPAERTAAVVVSEFCWSADEPGAIRLTLGGWSPRSGTIALPPGRHVLQLLVSSGRGFALRICSAAGFCCGTVREVCHWLTEPPLRYVKAGMDVADILIRLMQEFCAETPTPDLPSRQERMAALYRPLCPVTLPEEKNLRIETQETFLQCLTELLPQLMGASATADSVFPWRCFLIDANHSMQVIKNNPTLQAKDKQRSKKSPKAAAKDVSAKGSVRETGKSKKTNKEDTDKKSGDKSGEEEIANKGYSPLELSAITHIQASARKLLARKMRLAQVRGTSENARVQAEIARALPQLQQQADKLGSEMLRRMLEETRPLMDRYTFYPDLFHTANLTELSGDSEQATAGTPWFLLFRIGFKVLADEVVCVRPFVNAGFPVRLHLFDMGQQVLLNPDSHLGYPIRASYKSQEGYCLVAEGLTGGLAPVPIDGRWNCRILNQVHDRSMYSENRLIQLAPNVSSFATKELKDYYIPQEDGIVFNYYMRAGKGHPLTLQMAASHGKARVTIEILDNNHNLLASGEGIGRAVIPLFVLDGDEVFQPSVPRIEPEPSASKRKKGQSQHALGRKSGKGKRGRTPDSVKDSPTAGSSSSTSGDQSPSQVERVEHWDRYRVVGRVRAESWPLTRAQWEFVHKCKQKLIAQQYIFGPFEFSSQVDLKTSGTKKGKKNRKKSPHAHPRHSKTTPSAAGRHDSMSPLGASGQPPEPVLPQGQLDVNYPHVTLLLVSDQQRADDIEVFYNRDHVDAIRLEKSTWEAADAGRGERARRTRLQYLDDKTCRLPDAASVAAEQLQVAERKEADPEEQLLSTSAASEAQTKTSTANTEEFELLPANVEDRTELEKDDLPDPAASESASLAAGVAAAAEESESDPEWEPVFVEPQLAPTFVIHEVDTDQFRVEEPAEPRVGDDLYQKEQSELHELRIKEFGQQWTTVNQLMDREHASREQAKVDQMRSLHDALKPIATHRAFADVIRENYRTRVTREMAAAQAAAAEQSVTAKPSKRRK